MTNKNTIEIYQTNDGKTCVDVYFEQNTVWLTQGQIVELFDKNKRTISEHIRNIFKEGELQEDSVVRQSRITAADGKSYNVNHYNLDVIISVGYRVKSQQGTQFRIWATERLREYLVQGYALNQQRFDQNAAELQQAIALIRKAAQAPDINATTGRGLVEIVSRYTQTFLWLQRYDEGLLNDPQGQTGGDLPTPEIAMQALQELKQVLMARGEATALFAHPREDGLSAIFGNLNQSVFGESAYPTIESKAAHLLYFVVKNHPFSDGNKRSGAFLFVDFLHRNQRLLNERGEPVINDTGLAALTLLVAESDAKQKETLIRLIMHMLSTSGK
ncbi:RhuM family protein [Thiothrix unzii]|jgi:prophage maintenance system killer protein|uniref:RhuM family protein n=1 Tax=Thiothrix unzii TaxID=111769 RepID=UPI002A358763|nr:RhuM family protein [Thiothrix unzii]MDX9987990.1 RhuM family protein [Thiothrix unzii]